MFLKYLLFLFFLGYIEAFGPSSDCPYPRFDHGRFRMRQKSKLIKFVCFPGYTLVGNKYATCRNGEWDVPLPVCVKSGCGRVAIENGMPMISHGGAWVVFFCYPGHKLIGSPAIYCDGRKWNSTAPSCVDTKDPSLLSCNFEDPNLCGWTQDELHDFDWKRINKKTPSSFLFTGPSFDHTYGENKSGYFMYIESTSRLENDTARLISPLYNSDLTKNGCFQFFYHMFGKTTGGLRVYQKPENLPLPNLLQMSDSNRQKYLLFEKWGNLGDVWYTGVATLQDFGEDFQIIIEGIRGSSYTSDIAIDDVSILQGDSCSAAKNSATTPAPVISYSCYGRCDILALEIPKIPDLGCGCSVNCPAQGDCCTDFFDICVFETGTSTEENAAAELPQTQKLIAPTLSATYKPSTARILPSPPTRLISNTEAITSSQKRSPVSTSKIVITKTVPVTTKKTISTTPLTMTEKLSSFVISTTAKIVPTLKEYTPNSIPDKVYNISTTQAQNTTHKTVTTKPIIESTKKSTTKLVIMPTKKFAKQSRKEDKMKASKEQKIEGKTLKTEDKQDKSSGLTSILVIAGLLCCIAAVWLAVWSRGDRGRATLARIRGRVRNDPDVQYLHSSVDDD